MENEKKKWISVRITETLERTVTIKASSVPEAMSKVREAYYHEDIVLMAEDCTGVDFTIVDDDVDDDDE